MFNGLIETVGTVLAVRAIPAGCRARIQSRFAAELSDGDSIAVNGVCLTVVDTDAETFAVDVSPETAEVTTLGQISPETVVNLERPLKMDDRLGGHFVLGHVDGRGRVVASTQEADVRRVSVAYPPRLTLLIVEKGSIALDGISLTVAVLTKDRFDVQIVPYTWAHTNLQQVAVDDAVNLECDIIGKYVVNAVDAGARS